MTFCFCFVVNIRYYFVILSLFTQTTKFYERLDSYIVEDLCFMNWGLIDPTIPFFVPKIRLFPPKIQNKIIFHNLTFVKYFFGFLEEFQKTYNVNLK